MESRSDDDENVPQHISPTDIRLVPKIAPALPSDRRTIAALISSSPHKASLQREETELKKVARNLKREMKKKEAEEKAKTGENGADKKVAPKPRGRVIFILFF